MGHDEGDRRARHRRSAVVGLVDDVVVQRDRLYVGDVGLEARDTSGGSTNTQVGERGESPMLAQTGLALQTR